MKKNYMFTPGPTMVPSEVLLAEAQPMIHHRTAEFSEILVAVGERLKELFGTGQDVYTIAGSGTAAMEAAVANICSPGDKVVCVGGGKFGERWGELAAVYGCDVAGVNLKWGQSLSPERAASILEQNPGARALFVTHSETSTGALTDVQAIAALTRETETLLVVDAITSIGVHPFLMDEWGVDVAVSGSQKGCMIPPGLAFIAVSERAWPTVEQCASPRYYLDLRAMQKNWAKQTTPFTPPVSLIRALHAALCMMSDEGLENVHARHARMAEATRAAAKALGLELVAEYPANGVTAVYAPEGVDTGALTKKMAGDYGVRIAGGQSHLKGKIFRIGHMGYVCEEDLFVAIGALENALAALGHHFESGAGLKALGDVLGA